MKAFVIKNFGEPDNFQAVDLATPKLLPNYVLIKVAATSVNPVDIKIRQGAVVDIAPDFPAVLHGDVAGVIEATGNDIEGFKVGDEVYGCAGGVKGTGGALAEYMLADVNSIAHKPKSLTMAEASSITFSIYYRLGRTNRSRQDTKRSESSSIWWYWWSRSSWSAASKVGWGGSICYRVE